MLFNDLDFIIIVCSMQVLSLINQYLQIKKVNKLPLS